MVMARVVVWRHRPIVIAVTGSVGKTTTKEMIARVVGAHFSVRTSGKNFNNEIGVPLTILGVRHTLHGVRDVGRVARAWWRALWTTDYPRVVVLEYGVDHPGDMAYMTRIARPDIAVVTTIAPAHAAHFASVEDIAREKYALVARLQKNGMALVVADDPYRRVMPDPDPSCVVRTYGTAETAYYCVTDVRLCTNEQTVCGMAFKLNYEGKVIPVRLHAICAPHLAVAAAAALGVAHHLRINMVRAVEDLAHVVGAPGRMRLLRGRDGVVIVDDTYNASPSSMRAALQTISLMPAKRRVAIVGDMLELGALCARSHRAVADDIVKNAVDVVMTVGSHMRVAHNALLSDYNWSPQHVIHVATPDAAAATAVRLVRAGDLVLVKGSQGMRLEKVVAALLDADAEATRLLCRQDAVWTTRPFAPHGEPCAQVGMHAPVTTRESEARKGENV